MASVCRVESVSPGRVCRDGKAPASQHSVLSVADEITAKNTFISLDSCHRQNRLIWSHDFPIWNVILLMLWWSSYQRTLQYKSCFISLGCGALQSSKYQPTFRAKYSVFRVKTHAQRESKKYSALKMEILCSFEISLKFYQTSTSYPRKQY
jgi:hypothetical protein